MENEKNNSDFVLHANDVCTPQAMFAYADSAEQHGAVDVAANVRSQANAIINQQLQGGSVLPSLNTQACADTQQPPAENNEQQAPANNDAASTEQQQPQGEAPPANEGQANVQEQQQAPPSPPEPPQTEFPLSDYDILITGNVLTITKKAA